MARQVINRGNFPNDHAHADSTYVINGKINDMTAEQYSLQSQIISAGDIRFAALPTTEARISAARVQANVELKTIVSIPAVMLPHDPTLVDYSVPTIRNVREGGDYSELDVLAYGADGLSGPIDLAAATAVLAASAALPGLTVRMLNEPASKVSHSLSRMALEIIAHRGAGTMGSGAAAPENTICAVGYAAEWAHGMECDVQMSSDGTPVVIHDLTVDRTTDGTGTVASKTLAQLQALDAGTKFNARFAGARIPTMAAWLRAATQAARFLYPEIKAYRTTADIAVMVQTIIDLGLVDRCVIQSFNYATDFPFVRAVSKRIAIGPIVSTTGNWAAALPLASVDGNAAMIAEYTMILANPSFVTTARTAGVDVIAWSVDSTDAVRQLVDLGVRRIMSNRLVRSFTAV